MCISTQSSCRLYLYFSSPLLHGWKETVFSRVICIVTAGARQHRRIGCEHSILQKVTDGKMPPLSSRLASAAISSKTICTGRRCVPTRPSCMMTGNLGRWLWGADQDRNGTKRANKYGPCGVGTLAIRSVGSLWVWGRSCCLDCNLQTLASLPHTEKHCRCWSHLPDDRTDYVRGRVRPR